MHLNLKNNLFLISGISFSYLFYQEGAGVNVFIFTVILLLSIFLLNRDKLKDRTLILLSVLALLSATMVVVHHSWLALYVAVVCGIVLTGYQSNFKGTVISSIVIGTCSTLFSALVHLLNYISVEGVTVNKAQKKVNYSKLIYFIAPSLIIYIFMTLYRSGNPVFDSYMIVFIDDWFSRDRFSFTLIGFLLLTGVFYPILSSLLIRTDLENDDLLVRVRKKQKAVFNSILALKKEYLLGVILLAVLNMLLLVVNSIDLYHLFINKSLPSDISYSTYLHKGVYTLIWSIVIAIMIILYFFRGNQNFYKKNILLKYMAYVWIILNIMLVIGTLSKTQFYVHEYGLTYKRIGVYFYLLLCTIGLVTTALKIKLPGTIWFLLRKNVWATIFVLVFAACINWDMVITQYNLKYTQHKDIHYLLNLSYKNLPELEHYLSTDAQAESEKYYWYYNKKKAKFMEDHKTKGWKSWTYSVYRTKKKLSD